MSSGLPFFSIWEGKRNRQVIAPAWPSVSAPGVRHVGCLAPIRQQRHRPASRFPPLGVVALLMREPGRSVLNHWFCQT
jgi:hypothetical protein